MIPETMRNQRWAAIVGAAEDMGWRAEVVIEGFNFVATLSAEGACEQMIEGKLSQAEQILSDLGKPELYPAVEEYDAELEEEDAELDIEEALEAMEEAATAALMAPYDLTVEADNELTDEIAEEYLAAGEEDTAAGEGTGAEAPEETIAAGWKEAADMAEALDEAMSKETEHDPTNSLHEDVHDGMDRGPSPRELYQGTQVDLQDRGGIPRPTQVTGGDKMTVKFNGSEYVAPEGHHIEARKAGSKTRQYGRQVNEVEKKRMVIDHWFFYAIENSEPRKSEVEETLLAGGAITVENHRFVAAEGHRIIARKGSMYFEALSLNTSYQKSGWVLSVTQ